MIKGKVLQPDEIDFEWFMSSNGEEDPIALDLSEESEWQEVVELLPSPLKETVSVLEGTEELKMGLYCAVAIAGALMAGVKINYAGQYNYTGLMTMLFYPPASGKGKLALLPTVLKKINSEMIASNKRAVRSYNVEMELYKQSMKKGEQKEIPEKPSLPLIQASGDITSARLIEQLAENNGKETLLLYETEMDAYGIMASSGEHGKMNSMILRKAFHNEQISSMRKGNSEHLVVDQPKMATVLIGTASQIRKVIPNNQDGLLSRFLIVSGNAPLEWKDVQPCESCESLDDHYEKLSDIYYQMWKFFSGKSVEVKFTNDQWNWINQFGKERLLALDENHLEYASSIAKRHGNMTVRIAAICSMVNYFKRNDNAEIVVCADNDFSIAQKMVEESYRNSIELFKDLGKNNIVDMPLDNKQLYFRDLPNRFKLSEATVIADKHGMQGRTVLRRLREFKEEGLLYSPKKGEYFKLPVQTSVESLELTHL